MDPIKESVLVETRRQFFRRSATGIGGAALASLLQGAPTEGLPHFAPKAKRVIYMHMVGAPPQHPPHRTGIPPQTVGDGAGGEILAADAHPRR